MHIPCAQIFRESSPALASDRVLRSGAFRQYGILGAARCSSPSFFHGSLDQLSSKLLRRKLGRITGRVVATMSTKTTIRETPFYVSEILSPRGLGMSELCRSA